MEKKYNPWYYYNSNILIKNKKPCIPGDKVHISGMEGCFNVVDVKINYFIVIKKRQEIKITWDKFICLKGEGTSLEAQTKRGLKSALYQIESAQYNTSMLAKELTGFLKSLKK
jgi:hypothetical protein